MLLLFVHPIRIKYIYFIMYRSLFRSFSRHTIISSGLFVVNRDFKFLMIALNSLLHSNQLALFDISMSDSTTLFSVSVVLPPGVVTAPANRAFFAACSWADNSAIDRGGRFFMGRCLPLSGEPIPVLLLPSHKSALLAVLLWTLLLDGTGVNFSVSFASPFEHPASSDPIDRLLTGINRRFSSTVSRPSRIGRRHSRSSFT
mmetsp:Transcript_25347/g.45900  ORF Transcript_25347/g.45900 Transcript_25347/m.45900 type:complete len:201 (-) Transcript_25347:2885-3487(-)